MPIFPYPVGNADAHGKDQALLCDADAADLASIPGQPKRRLGLQKKHNSLPAGELMLAKMMAPS